MDPPSLYCPLFYREYLGTRHLKYKLTLVTRFLFKFYFNIYDNLPLSTIPLFISFFSLSTHSLSSFSSLKIYLPSPRSFGSDSSITNSFLNFLHSLSMYTYWFFLVRSVTYRSRETSILVSPFSSLEHAGTFLFPKMTLTLLFGNFQKSSPTMHRIKKIFLIRSTTYSHLLLSSSLFSVLW